MRSSPKSWRRAQAKDWAQVDAIRTPDDLSRAEVTALMRPDRKEL